MMHQFKKGLNIRQLALLVLTLIIANFSLQAQVTITASAGTASGSYTTLKGAFDAVNAGTHQGAIVININASTTETASAVLNGSGSGLASYSSINIYPTSDGLSISGNLDVPLIDLNGADNVTVDGRVNATGSTKSLTISNSSDANTAGTSTIRFINDATTNIVKYCTLKGSSRDAAAGIIFFSTTTATTGNDNNTIDNNNITMAGDTTRPVNAIYALGTITKNNESNTISNNNIYDFLNRNVASSGINIGNYNSTYNVSGNSFYETASFTANASVPYNVISINSATGDGNGFSVTGNYIGGTTVQCGGAAWTKTAQNNIFYAISITTAAGTASSIQGNTIQNINWSNSGSANFYGMLIGTVAGTSFISSNIGTIAGNIIGSSTGTGSIIFTNGGALSTFYGTYFGSIGATTFSNNIIGSITTGNSSTSGCNFYGIYKGNAPGSAAYTISNNIIGSNTSSSSINASANSASQQTVMGIYYTGSGTSGITNNTIANMVNATTQSTTTLSTPSTIIGIYCSNGVANTISGNIVHDLSIANNKTNSPSSSGFNSISGIFALSTGGLTQTVSNNIIYNLINTNNSFSGHVCGIFFNNATGNSNFISRNFIHSLSVVGASSNSAFISGIMTNSGSVAFSNNIVSLGGSSSTTLYGINEQISSGNNSKTYFNTINISGSLGSGVTNSSYAYFTSISSTLTRNIRNNIFINTRSTANATSMHYGLNISGAGTLTCDYNNYYVSGSGSVLGYYGGDKTSLPIVTGATGNDANSIATNPYFVNPGTTASGFSPTVPGTAVDGTGITVDFNNNTRTSPTFMGAFPSSPCSNPTSGGTIASAQSGNGPFNPAAFTSSAAPSGESGPLEYIWQSSTTSSSAGFSDIASSNGSTYDAGVLTQNTWFKRLARVGCKADWTGAAESNVLLVTVIKTWTGGSGNWNTASNWSDGVVPVSTDTFAIISGNPQLDTNFSVAGSLTLSGTGSLTINPGYTLSIASGGLADFGGKSVTFKSDATGTGQLGTVAGTLSNASNVTVERYIPSGKRAFRFLSSPVTTTTSIRQNWMEGATPSVWSGYPYTTTSAYNPNPGYGTQITGTGGATNGFDETLFNNPSLFSFNNSSGAWEATSSTTGTIGAGAAYRILIRGDRSYNMAANAEPVGGSTILRTTGTLAQGQLTTGVELPALSQSADGWSLVGNPYQSVVDLYSTDVVKNNVTDYYYIWDPRQGTRGAYVAYNMTLASGGSNNLSSGMTRYVQPGQAFFVQNTSTAGGNSLVFKEAAKGSTTEQTATFGSGTTGVDYSSLSAILFYTDSLAMGRTSMDATRVLFGNRFSNAINGEDGKKFTNLDETMSIRRVSSNLSMELRSKPDASTVVPLSISQYRIKRYTLRLYWDQPLQQDTLIAFLKDKYLGTETLINKSGYTDVVYQLDGQSASSASDRFEVVFKSTVINVAAIAGIPSVCVGTSTQMFNATPGGSWSSKNPAIASIDAKGTITGLAEGSTEVTYTINRYGMANTVSQLVQVHAIPGKPELKRDAAGNLVSSSATGNEWYSNNELIAGVNAAQYKPMNPAYYRVRVVQNGCVGELSNSYYYTTGPLLDAESGSFVRIFPNPVQREAKIEFRLKDQNAVQVEVYDMKGKKVLEYKNAMTGSKINLMGLSAGVYRFRVMNSSGIVIYSYTVVKE